MEHYLVIDQGTHASRCIVFDSSGSILAQTESSISIYRQKPQFIEHNPEKILASIYYCLDSLQSQGHLSAITAAALITQRSTIVGWDKASGKALSPAISWQDTRAADLLQPLQQDTIEIQKITGLPLSPHYGASKMQWLIKHNEKCHLAYQNNSLVLAPLASYLIKHLTGLTKAMTDHVNASRTQLFDINKLDWSPTMLKKFGLKAGCLPKAKPCLTDYGVLRQISIPLKLVNGDQNAAIFAQGIPPAEAILINIGTGAFALKLTDQPQPQPKLLQGLAVSQQNKSIFALEATVNGAGAALATLYNEIEAEHLYKELPNWLSFIHQPPVYINTISGLGSPWWNNTIKDHYLDNDACDLDLPEKAVAIIESIIFLLQNNIELLKDENSRFIFISGGLSKLDGLCQKLADLSQLEVRRLDNPEASAKGAAWLLANADHKTAHWKTEEATARFYPQPNRLLSERYQAFTAHLVTLTKEQEQTLAQATKESIQKQSNE